MFYCKWLFAKTDLLNGLYHHFKCYFKKPKDIFISVKNQTKIRVHVLFKIVLLVL